MDKQKSSGKPFDISKVEVWDAWLKVKGNQGAPGVDGQSLAAFEADLKNNLYKIWLRHEALVVRVTVRDRHRLAVVAAGEVGGSLNRGSPGRAGAASTKSGRFSTAGWVGPGERDGKVYERNWRRYAS